jgi:hypothetical protein
MQNSSVLAFLDLEAQVDNSSEEEEQESEDDDCLYPFSPDLTFEPEFYCQVSLFETNLGLLLPFLRF